MSDDDEKSRDAEGRRLEPIEDAAWPPEIADLVSGFSGQMNVYRVMAHHPALLRAWSDLREHIVNRSALDPGQSEVVILRAGFRLGSSYEWCQHIERARARGLSDARILALKGPLDAIAPDDRLLASAVDELFAHSALSPTTCDALVAGIGKEAVLDLMATVGFYSTLGFILNTFETPLDDDVRAKLETHPLAEASPADDAQRS